jgi:hypothetical protein
VVLVIMSFAAELKSRQARPSLVLGAIGGD